MNESKRNEDLIQAALETITPEVRDYIFGVSLKDLHHGGTHRWHVNLGEVEELQSVKLTHGREEFRAAVEKAGLPIAGGVAGAGRVLASDALEFGMLFGLAVGQQAARARSFADLDTHEEVLDASEAIQCYLAAAHEHDRVMLIGAPDRESIEKRKVYGKAAA